MTVGELLDLLVATTDKDMEVEFLETESIAGVASIHLRIVHGADIRIEREPRFNHVDT